MAENPSRVADTTGNLLHHWLERHEEYHAGFERQEPEENDEIPQNVEDENEDIRIDPYIPYLTAPISWLPALVDRIHGSILPDGYEGEMSTEWLREEAARAAITFFRNGADLLPTEPHIYASKSGDLVAEFETEKGSITSIISDNETVLFLVLASDPHEPIQSVIRRGSNQFRDELRSFTRNLDLGSHGPLETAE